MKTNRKMFILCTAVAVLIVISVAAYCSKNSHKSIVGTYCTGTGMSSEDEYIMFRYDGTLVMYQQLDAVEEGSYSTREEKNLLMVSIEVDSGTELSAIFDYDDSVFVLGDNWNNVAEFMRISDEPTLINVE